MQRSPGHWTSLLARRCAWTPDRADGLATTPDRTRPDRVDERRLDGTQATHVIALACSVTPDAQEPWRLRLLADAVVRLEVVETIFHATVRQTLEKPSSRPT
jgi:hypothetical protein